MSKEFIRVENNLGMIHEYESDTDVENESFKKKAKWSVLAFLSVAVFLAVMIKNDFDRRTSG